MKSLLVLLLARATLAGCADQSAVRLGGNMARIDVSAAPVYGGQGATDMALTLAAQETLASGFTHFTVVDFDSRFDSQVIGVLPGQSSVSGTFTPRYGNIYGSSTGPQPIMRVRNERAMIIQMLDADDPRSQGAYEAQSLLE